MKWQEKQAKKGNIMTYKEELEYIRQSNGGFLRPQDVVEYARNQETELHKRFTWDDGEAAEKWRLAEARAIIRVVVQVHEQSSEKVRAFVSLTQDRKEDKGYRAFVEILDDEALSAAMLQDAINELASFRRKYKKLQEAAQLSGVFSAIDALDVADKVA